MFERPVPDRVAADLRAHEAAQDRLPAPSEEDMRDARAALEEELLAGKRIGRVDLEAILDQELNDNYAAALRSLYEHLARIGALDPHDQIIRCQAADAWMQRLVRAYLDSDPDMVEERAALIAKQRQEDCDEH